MFNPNAPGACVFGVRWAGGEEGEATEVKTEGLHSIGVYAIWERKSAWDILRNINAISAYRCADLFSRAIDPDSSTYNVAVSGLFKLKSVTIQA